MQHRLFDFLNSRQLPTGRRIFAMKAIRRAAEDFGEPGIVARCERSIAGEQEMLRLEMAYREGRSFASRARGLASEYDREIDAIWAGMQGIAQGHQVLEGAVAQQATDLLKQVFPDGLAGLVNQPFEAQLAEMDILLERFDAPTGDLAGHINTLGLRRLVDMLRVLVPKFRAELEADAAAKVTYEQVKSARLDCLDRFASVVFMVLNTYATDSAQDVERRAACLAEYHRQNASVVEAYRRQSRVPDVDPETGEPLVEPDSAESEIPELDADPLA